jgi:hypothetical protein
MATFADWEKQNYAGSLGANRQKRVKAFQRLTAKPKPAAPAATPFKYTPPNFDELDAEGQANSAAYDSARRRALRDADAGYEAVKADVGASRIQAGYARDEGYRGVDNNAAARGMVRSGIRDLGRTKVGTEYDRVMGDLDRVYSRAVTDRNSAKSDAESAYAESNAQNRVGSAQRYLDKWTAEKDGLVHGTAAAQVGPSAPIQRQPTMSYKDFLKGRGSTTALAQLWNKKHNYSQNKKLGV